MCDMEYEDDIIINKNGLIDDTNDDLFGKGDEENEKSDESEYSSETEEDEDDDSENENKRTSKMDEDDDENFLSRKIQSDLFSINIEKSTFIEYNKKFIKHEPFNKEYHINKLTDNEIIQILTIFVLERLNNGTLKLNNKEEFKKYVKDIFSENIKIQRPISNGTIVDINLQDLYIDIDYIMNEVVSKMNIINL